MPDGSETSSTAGGADATSSPPFVETPGGVAYQGSAGDTLVASNESLSTALDGELPWLQAPTATPGVTISVFDVFDAAIASLSTANVTDPQVAAAVKTGIADLDTFHAHLLSTRARTGEALNRMDQAELRIADGKLAAQVDRSNAEDLDLVQAISDFQNRQSGYDAALKAYSMVQKLSLFNYISG